MGKTGKTVLGRGLGALIPTGGKSSEPVSVVPTQETRDDGVSEEVFAHIAVSDIDSNPYQPRVDFDSEALRELAQSIHENGLVQPVTVRRWEGRFQLISGERRLRACQQAGITHIPAYIRRVESAEEMIELALIENIQRAMLNPVEIAHSYQQLLDEFGYTAEQIARKVGKDRSTVVNFIRLLKLPRRIQESVQKAEIGMGHARALISLSDEEAQLRLWQRILRESLSVRKVEEAVRNMHSRTPPSHSVKPIAKKSAASSAFDAVIHRLRPIYGTKIHVTTGKDGAGSVSFEFYSDDDFERLIELFESVKENS